MSEAKETIITDDEPEHDDTDELYQSVFIKNEKTRPLPGSNTSIYKQKFDCFHPASRAFSHGTYALYREKALHESCQVPVEHAQSVAKIHFWNRPL